jgi:protocatechuate 3,4-dioxygenase beta subunit
MYSEYQKFKHSVASEQHIIQLVPTSSDIEGPFYKSGAPFRELLVPDKVEPTLHLTGVVTDVYGNNLLDVVLDFWQANAKGEYDNTGFDFRGKVKTTKDGYSLHTIHPGFYQIGENEYRCSHIHVKVSHPEYRLLTTQLYFYGDKYDDTDHWFSPDRVIGLPTQPNPKFNFVLEKLNS